MIRMRSSGLSDVGLTRRHNEDCYEIDPVHHLYIVADGMGGHSHGEVASRITVAAMQNFIEGSANDSASSGDSQHQPHSERLCEAIREAHQQVLHAIDKNGALQGMGTTVVSLMLEDGIAAVAHVGDSRAYRVRGGQLELLTQDHTWVNEQVVAGYLSEEQARVHPLKNVVTRALGSEKDVRVDLSEVRVAPGDLFLLCSDGLTTMLNDREIGERLSLQKPLEEICRNLVEEANARGGLDNVTVVLMLAEEEPDRDLSPEEVNAATG